jgi:hypothetical protein
MFVQLNKKEVAFKIDLQKVHADEPYFPVCSENMPAFGKS